MSTNPSKFVWYELMTSDVQAAESFYRSVVGWDARDSGLADRSYTIFSMGPAPVGGLMPIPEHVSAAGGKPGWTGYIGVDDVDAYAGRIEAAGGRIHHVPEDIPGVGRFAVAADPQNAIFALFKGACDEPPPQIPAGAPGHVDWHELHAGEGESAFDFYAGLFGWTKAEAVDMGAMGIYQTFSMGDARAAGGVMTKMPDTPAPFWLFYFSVDAIDAAMARVDQNGGQAITEPMQVPGGRWIVHCLDPQGAIFALVAAQR